MHVTVLGNVATEVRYGETSGGVPMANFQLGCTERRYDREHACWVDGETQWLRVTAWRALAVNLIGSLAKGDPVLVTGRLRVHEWTEGEVKRSRAEINARSVGHDLTRGTSAFRWATGVREQPSSAAGGAAAQAASEPVPGWIVNALESRRASAVAAAPRLFEPPGAGPVTERQESVSEGERGGEDRAMPS
ncbi:MULTISPECIES: single-stranded DNA-binding protein [Kitasatospora]|uniref:Single-stranded DNA-binding protein n=1 Tax=Kitasatospora cathayae TaxID=3004092 RepID=A0ABY7QFN3_9ACTN|nr:single-stranded DNA-binding protein [Kitasatospora sp. HUAS 3-15]WBP91576.1 single-stranded DNA-binding protein [Kitasatospora sp. HUAS 3-15]